MPLSDIIRSLYGMWRIILLDPRGVHFFDNTRERTLRSFAIPVICYAVMVLLITQNIEQYNGNISLSLAMLVQTLGFAITLCGYLLMTYSLVKQLDKKQDFMRYVQANNWMAILALALSIPVVVVGNLDQPTMQFFFLMLMIFRKIYDWFVIQSVFKIQWYWILLILMGGEVIDALVTAMAYTTIY